MIIRNALMTVFAVSMMVIPVALGGCDNPLGPKKQVGTDAGGDDVNARYPGPFDETLTEAQRDQLRQRGNLQR